MIASTLAAFFAGYTDAEGCIRLPTLPCASAHLRIIFDQTNPAVVLEIQKHFGGSLTDRVPKKGRRQVSLVLSGVDAKEFAQAVRPFLKTKKSQCEIVLRALEAHGTRIPPNELRDIQEYLRHDKAIEMPHDFPWTQEGYNKRKWGAAFVYGRVVTEEEKAYWAGFLDGDGSLDVDHQRICVVFSQVNGYPLFDLVSAYGGTLRPEQRGNLRVKVVYRLRARAAVEQFLKDVYPYVVEKRAQVEAVQQSWHPKMAEEEIEGLRALLAALRREEIPKGYVQYLKDTGVVRHKHDGVRKVRTRRFALTLKDGEVVVKAANYEEASKLRMQLLDGSS